MKNEPAFPIKNDFDVHKGMTLRDYFAIHAPEPSNDKVAQEQERDRMRNPHNDGPPKPKIRSEYEIRTELRYRYAAAMLAEREKQS